MNLKHELNCLWTFHTPKLLNQWVYSTMYMNILTNYKLTIQCKYNVKEEKVHVKVPVPNKARTYMHYLQCSIHSFYIWTSILGFYSTNICTFSYKHWPWYSLGSPSAERNPSLLVREEKIMILCGKAWGVTWWMESLGKSLDQKPLGPAGPLGFGLGTSQWTPFPMIPTRLFNTLDHYMCDVYRAVIARDSIPHETHSAFQHIRPLYVWCLACCDCCVMYGIGCESRQWQKDWELSTAQ